MIFSPSIYRRRYFLLLASVFSDKLLLPVEVGVEAEEKLGGEEVKVNLFKII